MKRDSKKSQGNPTRISIFGTPGSGKTYLALQLGEITNIPVYHLDKLLWDTGWVLRDKDEFLKDQISIINTQEWIIEGSALSTLEHRYQNSQLVIFLKPSRLLCLYRVINRFIFQKKILPDKLEGNKERLTWDFMKYLWRFPKKANQLARSLERIYPDVQLIEINSRDLEKIYSLFHQQ